MRGEFKTGLLIISILSGALNFFLLGFSIGLSSGRHEAIAGATIANMSFWSSAVHVLIASWLFILFPVFGRLLAILTSLAAALAPVLILSRGFSLLWFLAVMCFVITALMHTIALNRKHKV